jgi:hypothetical protein
MSYEIRRNNSKNCILQKFRQLSVQLIRHFITMGLVFALVLVWMVTWPIFHFSSTIGLHVKQTGIRQKDWKGKWSAKGQA